MRYVISQSWDSRVQGSKVGKLCLTQLQFTSIDTSYRFLSREVHDPMGFAGPTRWTLLSWLYESLNGWEHPHKAKVIKASEDDCCVMYLSTIKDSNEITVTDAMELAKHYASSAKDQNFWSALREESNRHGDLAVSMLSGDRSLWNDSKLTLKITVTLKAVNSLFMRGGVKDLFHLVMT